MSKLIEMGKKYTSNGKPVTIRYVDGKAKEYCVGAEFENGDIRLFSSTGESIIGKPSRLDLVEVSPYAGWKIGQRIMVSIDGVTWCKRYFAGIDGVGGYALTWANGATSWSRDIHRASMAWKYARLPTPEELGELP